MPHVCNLDMVYDAAMPEFLPIFAHGLSSARRAVIVAPTVGKEPK